MTSHLRRFINIITIIIIHPIIIIIIIWMTLVTGLFCLVLLLNQRWSPPLKLQVSHCSTFRIIIIIIIIIISKFLE